MAKQVQALLTDLVQRMGVRRPVRMLKARAWAVPMLVGAFKPLILMPPAMLLGLSTAQLQAVLAHELAHVRRYDYLVLLLQRLAETLLFYHPGIWWLSRRLQLEQEQCCDDVAALRLSVIAACMRGRWRPLRKSDCRASPGAAWGMTPALAATGSGATQLLRRMCPPAGTGASQRPTAQCARPRRPW